MLPTECIAGLWDGTEPASWSTLGIDSVSGLSGFLRSLRVPRLHLATKPIHSKGSRSSERDVRAEFDSCMDSEQQIMPWRVLPSSRLLAFTSSLHQPRLAELCSPASATTFTLPNSPLPPPIAPPPCLHTGGKRCLSPWTIIIGQKIEGVPGQSDHRNGRS